MISRFINAEGPVKAGPSAFICFVLSMRLLLVQLPFHCINIALQLVDALPLTLLYEPSYKEKQEENHKSDYHLTPSFQSNERINVYLIERYGKAWFLSSGVCDRAKL